MSRFGRTLVILVAVLILGVTVVAAMNVGDDPTPRAPRHVAPGHGTGAAPSSGALAAASKVVLPRPA